MLEEDEVALLLDGNYDTTFQPWCDQSGPNPQNNACNADGLVSKFNEIASAWNKLGKNQISLPSAVQISVADGLGESGYGVCPTLTSTWLGGSDYWTSTVFNNEAARVWNVISAGYISFDNFVYNASYGVRPVVNIKL